MVYLTYNGYVMSQFKKLQADLRNKGEVKWKHVMHLLRLLLAGIAILEQGQLPVHVGEHRERLLSVKRGELSFELCEAWRLEFVGCRRGAHRVPIDLRDAGKVARLGRTEPE